jgi:hypothetical protein
VDNDPIEVESYSGYKADEYPVSFYWKGKKFEIKEITDRWYQSDPTVEWLVINYFKVLTRNNLQCIIKHDIEIDKWYLVKYFEIRDK